MIPFPTMVLGATLCGRLAIAAAPQPPSKLPSPPPDPALLVPTPDRVAETTRLRELGLHVPEGGVVLERPWDEPFSRRSFVVPQAWFHRPPPDAGVLADSLAKDLAVLEAVMSRAYGGWDSARARGWSWKKWFSDWRDSLEKRKGQMLSLREAFEPVRQLMQFQLDNHTNIPLSLETYFGSGSQSFVLQGSTAGSCIAVKAANGAVTKLDPRDPAQQARSAKRWDSKTQSLQAISYLSVPGNRGDLAAVKCGKRWYHLKPAWPTRLNVFDRESAKPRLKPVLALSGAERDEPTLKILEPGVAYARFPSFSKTNTQLIEQRSNSWLKPSGKERVLIVDLRDNQGGDVAINALRGWLDDEDNQRLQAALNTHRREGASCLYHALRWGYSVYSSQGVRPPLGEELTQRFQGGVDDLFQSSPPACPRAFEDRHGGWDYRQHQMRPPGQVEGHRRIVVVVNNGTGSDGELMTMLLASLPQTVVVGTNTFGVAQYIQPGYSVLPHTRLPFRIALGTSDAYGDNRSFDGYGFDVDVVLATEEDQAPDNLLALAKYIGG